jgi:DNA-binding XRE family transcriptional regulator
MVTTQAESGFDIKRLKLYREKARLTQTELGKRAGISLAQIGNLEKGRCIPFRSTLAKLYAALSAYFPGGLPGGGMYADGLRRAAYPHCGAPNCHTLEVCIPGIELQCISCSRVFRLDAKGRAYVPEPPSGKGEKTGPRMSGEARANISAGQRRRRAREREERL